MDPYADVVTSYTDFAEHAADSPCFVEWSLGVLGDAAMLEKITSLPPIKQQPNLVFAAARWHGAAAPGPYEGFRRTMLQQWSAVEQTILSRSTQTNEVGRLATLVPAFATLGERLNLIEVGASAGLCLFPDDYRYEWARYDNGYDDPGAVHSVGTGPALPCRVCGPVPLPDRVPEVSWRAGIDLEPLDVTVPDQMAWLENLVWPEQEHRLARLRSAIEMTRRHPPELVTGNLLDTLPEVLSRAPDTSPTVVFHSAVIAYLEEADRRRFASMMESLVREGTCHWVSNESRRVLPEVTSTGEDAGDHGDFVLGVDGRSVALTHGHGSTLRWHTPHLGSSALRLMPSLR